MNAQELDQFDVMNKRGEALQSRLLEFALAHESNAPPAPPEGFEHVAPDGEWRQAVSGDWLWNGGPDKPIQRMSLYAKSPTPKKHWILRPVSKVAPPAPEGFEHAKPGGERRKAKFGEWVWDPALWPLVPEVWRFTGSTQDSYWILRKLPHVPTCEERYGKPMDQLECPAGWRAKEYRIAKEGDFLLAIGISGATPSVALRAFGPGTVPCVILERVPVPTIRDVYGADEANLTIPVGCKKTGFQEVRAGDLYLGVDGHPYTAHTYYAAGGQFRIILERIPVPTVESIYGKPQSEIPIPKGKRVKEFRAPETDEMFVSQDDGNPVFTANRHWPGPRLILEDEPEPTKRVIVVSIYDGPESAVNLIGFPSEGYTNHTQEGVTIRRVTLRNPAWIFEETGEAARQLKAGDFGMMEDRNATWACLPYKDGRLGSLNDYRPLRPIEVPKGKESR